MAETGSLKLFKNRPGPAQGKCCLKNVGDFDLTLFWYSPMNMNSDIYELKIVIKFYDFLFDNLDIESVDKYFFGNINEKGEIGTNSEYLRQIDYLGKNLIEYFKKSDQKDS